MERVVSKIKITLISWRRMTRQYRLWLLRYQIQRRSYPRASLMLWISRSLWMSVISTACRTSSKLKNYWKTGKKVKRNIGIKFLLERMTFWKRSLRKSRRVSWLFREPIFATEGVTSRWMCCNRCWLSNSSLFRII